MYYLATLLRNKLYDYGINSSKSYDFPVICVGNLSVGGTGKSPMIEYLIRLLKNNHKVATLSRGYKRKTKGFVIANQTLNTDDVGDEPYQFFKKFDDIIVSVHANRRDGIELLRNLNEPPSLILLDDAYQHRRVKAGLNILLTTFNDLYTEDVLLPTGNLREPKSGAKRADIIVVTKCPQGITETNKSKLKNSLKPLNHQHVFFSSIVYSEKIKNFNDEKKLSDLKETRFTLVTGIANSKPFVEHLQNKGLNFEHLNFKDHHDFSEKELENLRNKAFILTTEKDYVRLAPNFKNSERLYYLPIEIAIDGVSKFDQLITKFVTSFK
jgi:tetraacyldisaccharide 4'-kinase